MFDALNRLIGDSLPTLIDLHKPKSLGDVDAQVYVYVESPVVLVHGP